jgi:hypothetical protein
LTPSTPRCQEGQPNPQATIGGRARIEEALRNPIERVELEDVGWMKIRDDFSAFSGMDKKEGI